MKKIFWLYYYSSLITLVILFGVQTLDAQSIGSMNAQKSSKSGFGFRV